MESGVVSALAFGDHTFTCPSGAAFGDGTTSKTISLGAGNKIQALTDMLKIEYLTLVISSNMDGTQFKLTYTSSDGTAKEDVVSAGSHLLKLTKGTTVKVEASETPKGWTAPAATNVTMSSTSNSVTMDFTEEVLVYIADTSGNLYTEAEWTASGKTNDQAEGVCVMRAKSGGFIVAKEDASSSTLAWSGNELEISGIGSYMSSDEAKAKKDFDGYNNTIKIIEQGAGHTSNGITGTPAAEACANYVFASGAKGYLPALGELIIANNNKSVINSILTFIGGGNFLNNSYWSSTQFHLTSSWYVGFSGTYASYTTKATKFNVRSFAPIGLLTINSTLATKFTLSYTNNYDDVVTEKVSQGSHNLNVKNGTQVIVTPDAIGSITTEPQTFTWQGFTHECNFVFAKDAGVYIQHINDSLYTESEWTAGGYANRDANGVAVLSSDASFVIAKSKLGGNSGLAWGGYNKTITGITTETSQLKAILDFDGYNNTAKIIEQCKEYKDPSYGITGAPAAEACAAFTFPNSKKGYLPSLGESVTVLNNIASVDSAMSIIGGVSMSGGNTWSSTQAYSSDSWCINYSYGTITYTGKAAKENVRPFTTV